MEGWFKIDRKIVNWEWYSDTITFRVFFHLLATANYENKKWKGLSIKRGQVFSSYQSIIEGIGDFSYSKQNIRTAIKKLRKTGEITVQSTHNGLLITINKYDFYQFENIKTTDQVTRYATDH